MQGYWYGPFWKGFKARWEREHPDTPLGSAAGVTPRLAAADQTATPAADAGSALPHPLPAAALPRVALLYASVTVGWKGRLLGVGCVRRGARGDEEALLAKQAATYRLPNPILCLLPAGHD